MKNGKIKAALCLALSLLASLLCVSCSKPEGSVGEKDGGYETVSGEGIVGRWRLAESEWLSADKPEFWCFTSDGKYTHTQTDGQGNITGEVDGSYVLKENKLTLTVSDWVQPEGVVAFADGSTMNYTNHEKTIELKRVK